MILLFKPESTGADPMVRVIRAAREAKKEGRLSWPIIESIGTLPSANSLRARTMH
jgi:hypothetical protein